MTIVALIDDVSMIEIILDVYFVKAHNVGVSHFPTRYIPIQLAIILIYSVL